VALYQGFPCAAVTFRRARGFAASSSTVELDLEAYGPGFTLRVDPHAAPVRSDPAAAMALVLGPPGAPALAPEAPRARALASYGDLILAEVDPEGRAWPVDGPLVIPLHVVRLETAARAADGSVSRVRLTLADDRMLWDRGLLSRWSYNRRRAGGELATDAVRPDGRPFTWADTARAILADLPRRPALGEFPARLADGLASLEAEPLAAAADGLGALVRQLRLAEPCLRLDGTVALHRAGEGRLGYAPGGRGGNTVPLPEALVLHAEGRGRGTEQEPTYVPDVVYVLGGPRIATVRLTGWEPVLVLAGKVHPLDEATVRRLTGGRLGLAWLQRWVLSPGAFKAVPGLPQDVAEVLADQAWRLYRAPLVEVLAQPEEAPRAVPAAAVDPASPARGVALLPPLTKLGPNAHYLPLLPRAEAEAGGRDPIEADTVSFVPIASVYLSDSRAQLRLAAELELDRLRELIRRTSVVRTGGVPLEGSPAKAPFAGAGDAGNRFSDAYTERLTEELVSEAGVTVEAYRAALRDARAIAETRKQASESLAADYESALRARNDATPGGMANLLLDAAQEVLRLEAELLEARGSVETGSIAIIGSVFGGISADVDAAAYAGLVEAAKERLRRLAEEALRAAREAAARAGAGGAEPEPVAHYQHLNMPRSLDPGASVYDADRGIVQLSRLPGFVERADVVDPRTPLERYDEANNKGPFQVEVADLAAARFLPLPVAVTFGARVRPRRDLPWGARGPATGLAATAVVVETDEGTFYRAVFRRGAEGAPIRAEASPELRARAFPLRHPELVELIPLSGAGNRAALDASAAELARDAFAQPVLVAEERLLLARPWPVQCDGVVSAVEVALRERGAGFTTEVHVGLTPPIELRGPNETRPRVRAAELHSTTRDAIVREGLSS
jgi:hypothetical protein